MVSTKSTPIIKYSQISGLRPRPQLPRNPPRYGTSYAQAISQIANIPPTQRTLQHFYGVGPQVASHLMARLHIHPTARLGSLSNQTVLDITAELSSMKIENDLRREMVSNIKRMRDIGSYRGRRHAMGMPVRGQRTRTQTSTANKLNKVERRA